MEWQIREDLEEKNRKDWSEQQDALDNLPPKVDWHTAAVEELRAEAATSLGHSSSETLTFHLLYNYKTKQLLDLQTLWYHMKKEGLS